MLKYGLIILIALVPLFINKDNLAPARFFFFLGLALYLLRQEFTFIHYLFTHILFFGLLFYTAYNIWTNKFFGVFDKGFEFMDARQEIKVDGEVKGIKLIASGVSQQFLYTGLFLLTFINIYIFFLSKTFNKKLENKVGSYGDKGNRGLKGKKGKTSTCEGGCSDDLCYRKIMGNITKVYNEFCKRNVLEELPDNKFINNLFIKRKCRTMCNSEAFKNMMGLKGAKDTYDYLFEKWREWINIILKYERGKEFIDSEHSTDNDFDYMITDNDKKVVDGFNVDDPGTPSGGKESPFDEIKKYDIWYWGSPKAARPTFIESCTSVDKVPEPILKMKNTNTYGTLWRSGTARQSLTNVGFRNGLSCESKLQYLPNKQKGSSKVTVYRADDFHTHDKLKYRKYSPMGDAIIEGDILCHKKDVNDSLPFVEDENNTLNKSRYVGSNGSEGSPIKQVQVVTGDVKKPVDYQLIGYSRRNTGLNIREKNGYSFWKPIPPQGYKCLGDVMSTNYDKNVKPSLNLVSCVPDKCVRKVSNVNKMWDGITPVSADPVKSSCNADREYRHSSSKRDTDDNDLNNLKIYTNRETNLMSATKSNSVPDMYEIIPKNESGSCLDSIVVDKSEFVNKWEVPEKLDLDYSILNIYNE